MQMCKLFLNVIDCDQKNLTFSVPAAGGTGFPRARTAWNEKTPDRMVRGTGIYRLAR